MSDSGLQIRVTRLEAGAHVVTVTGEMNLDSAPLLKEELQRLPSTSDVLVDLGRASIIESTVVSVLLRAAQRLRRSGSLLILVCEQESIRQLFERTRLNEMVLVEDSLDDALHYLIGWILLKRLRPGASVAI